jgi:TonB family protein
MRFIAACLLGPAVVLAAQSSAPSPQPIPVTPQEILSHRIGHDNPVYPRFALAAGIEGDVKVQVAISADGSVQSQGEATGPPSLIPSALSWIAAGKFRPFLRDGNAVAVSATLPVAFRLPQNSHSAHPLRALYQRNITLSIESEGPDNPPRARWAALSPVMHQWLARYQASISDAGIQDLSLDQIVARETAAQPLAQMPSDLVIYQIPLALPRHRLYVLFEFGQRCGKTNCPLALLEESAAGVHTLASEKGIEVDFHRRRDSPYPDALIWSDTGQPGISRIVGYSYYGGQWGVLYCGTDSSYEDNQRDAQVAEHRGVRVPPPPLVTVCH